jgi:Tfp pilus assembly protein PilF
LTAFQRAADLDDENLPAAAALAHLRWRRGDYDEARARAEAFLKLAASYPKSEFLDAQIESAKKIIAECDALKRSR